MDGVVVVDKPAGMTSHDVVDAVRRKLGTRKVGHAGTLDPDATGLLVLGVGKATRLLAYAGAGDKRYSATARFGVTTTTQDASGETVATRDASRLDRETLLAALPALVGEITQVPPMVSAVKVGGERLYRMARRGEEVERAPRPVTIHRLDLVAFAAGETVEAQLDVVCSPGTYVRTLVHDLGEALGCGAHLVELRRTESSGFTESDAIPLDDIAAGSLRPPLDALRGLARIDVSEAAATDVSHGRALPAPDDAPADGALVVLVRGDRLLGVYVRKGPALVPDRVIPS